MDKNLTCFFTGHRKLYETEFEVRSKTAVLISKLYGEGVRRFIAGGAIGFDTLAAETVLTLKESGLSDIKLYIYVPCEGQDKYFTPEQKEKYSAVISAADDVLVMSDKYFRGCMHARNRKMADDSAYCIAYVRKQSGGTAYTVGYAKKSGVDISFVD